MGLNLWIQQRRCIECSGSGSLITSVLDSDPLNIYIYIYIYLPTHYILDSSNVSDCNFNYIFFQIHIWDLINADFHNIFFICVFTGRIWIRIPLEVDNWIRILAKGLKMNIEAELPRKWLLEVYAGCLSLYFKFSLIRIHVNIWSGSAILSVLYYLLCGRLLSSIFQGIKTFKGYFQNLDQI